MLPFLTEPFAAGPAVAPASVLVRLVGALILGGVVALIYRRTRGALDLSPSFPTTLILLSILIAMVTQVIGDNVARAFSLVGALSIVRFRTVVRDTQDTAYVIFAVVVGMAVGAADLWVAGIGIGVVGLAAFLTMTPSVAGGAGTSTGTGPIFLLTTRVAIGHDVTAAIDALLDAASPGRRLVSMGTTKQGLAIETAREIRLAGGAEADDLVRRLNRIDGMQSVELTLRNEVTP